MLLIEVRTDTDIYVDGVPPVLRQTERVSRVPLFPGKKEPFPERAYQPRVQGLNASRSGTRQRTPGVLAVGVRRIILKPVTLFGVSPSLGPSVRFCIIYALGPTESGRQLSVDSVPSGGSSSLRCGLRRLRKENRVHG